MPATVLVSFSLLALVVTARPIVPRDSLCARFLSPRGTPLLTSLPIAGGQSLTSKYRTLFKRTLSPVPSERTPMLYLVAH